MPNHNLPSIRISGSMLYNLVECPHRLTMDLFADSRERDQVSPFVQMLWDRGATHEREVISKTEGAFLDLSNYSASEKERLTLAAMARGEQLIYGGRISYADLVGEPDLLQKQETGYIAGDIKSGRGEEGAREHDDGKPKLHYAVQLALYTDILERLEYAAGRTPFILDINDEVVPYDLMALRGSKNPHCLWDDYEGYLAQARSIITRQVQTLPAYSTSVCKNCVWYTSCLKSLEASNDLTLIPQLGRSNRDTLVSQIASIRQLAEIRPEDFLHQGKSVFAGIGSQTLEKFHERAKLISAEDGKPYLRHPVTFRFLTGSCFSILKWIRCVISVICMDS